MSHPSTTLELLLADEAWARRLARSLVGAADGDDLVQDLFLDAAEGRLRPQPFSRAWLGTVLRNRAVNVLRERGRRTGREASVARRERVEETPEAVQGRIEQRQVLGQLLLDLPEPLRTAVMLRYERQLSSASIAELQGVSASAVRGRIAEGLRRLRGELDARSGGERETWLRAFAPLAGVRIVEGGAVARAVAAAGWSAGIAALAFGGSRWLLSEGPQDLPTPGESGLSVVETSLGPEVGSSPVPVLVEREPGPEAAPAATAAETLGSVAPGLAQAGGERRRLVVVDLEGRPVGAARGSFGGDGFEGAAALVLGADGRAVLELGDVEAEQPLGPNEGDLLALDGFVTLGRSGLYPTGNPGVRDQVFVVARESELRVTASRPLERDLLPELDFVERIDSAAHPSGSGHVPVEWLEPALELRSPEGDRPVEGFSATVPVGLALGLSLDGRESWESSEERVWSAVDAGGALRESESGGARALRLEAPGTLDVRLEMPALARLTLVDQRGGLERLEDAFEPDSLLVRFERSSAQGTRTHSFRTFLRAGGTRELLLWGAEPGARVSASSLESALPVAAAGVVSEDGTLALELVQRPGAALSGVVIESPLSGRSKHTELERERGRLPAEGIYDLTQAVTLIAVPVGGDALDAATVEARVGLPFHVPVGGEVERYRLFGHVHGTDGSLDFGTHAAGASGLRLTFDGTARARVTVDVRCRSGSLERVDILRRPSLGAGETLALPSEAAFRSAPGSYRSGWSPVGRRGGTGSASAGATLVLGAGRVDLLVRPHFAGGVVGPELLLPALGAPASGRLELTFEPLRELELDLGGRRATAGELRLLDAAAEDLLRDPVRCDVLETVPVPASGPMRLSIPQHARPAAAQLFDRAGRSLGVAQLVRRAEEPEVWALR